jgi:hypothetical protein
MAIEMKADSPSAFLVGFCTGLNVGHGMKEIDVRGFLGPLAGQSRLYWTRRSWWNTRRRSRSCWKRETLWRSDIEKARGVVFAVLGTTAEGQLAGSAPALVFDEPPADCRIDFNGCRVVITGDFEMGRQNAEAVVEALGAEVQSTTHRDTDYVVVGSIPNPSWKFGKYGNKVSRAMELRQVGDNPVIISEKTFLALVPPDTIQRAVSVAQQAVGIVKLRVPGFTVLPGGSV